MRPSYINQILSIMMKDLRSEFRTRFAISSVFLFVLVTVTMIIFSLRGENISNSELSGLLWITFFFGSMTGLSKSFVSEEERQTSLFLKICLPSFAVYFGKLLFNIILSLSINIISSIMFYFLLDFVPGSLLIFILILILSSIGIGSSTTIISAIISKANNRGAIFPILSFPVLLPLILLGIEATTKALEDSSLSTVQNDLLILLSFSGVIIPVSYILFDFVWQE